MQTKTRIIIADIHEIVRKGVCQEIAKQMDMEVVGETDDGNDVLTLARELRPDVVVLDVKLAGLDAVEVTRELQKITLHGSEASSRVTAVLFVEE